MQTTPRQSPAIVHPHVRHAIEQLNVKPAYVLNPDARELEYAHHLAALSYVKAVAAVEPRASTGTRSKRVELFRIPMSDFYGLTTARFDLVIGQPKFITAADTVQRCHEMLTEDGMISFLLKLSFLGSQFRRDFWKEYPCSQVSILRPRPYFSRGDTEDYAVFSWRKTRPLFHTISHLDWR